MTTYSICLSLSDILLSIILSRYIHVIANDRISFFLWLNNIPLCVDIYHIFFIYSFVHGHLGCFHVLPIVNSAAMKNGVHVFFELVFSFPLDIYLGVELLDHIVVLILVF